MNDLLDVDSIALLPRDQPYAARFLAGLLAFEREPVELAWADEVPEPLASLARACARRGWDWSMGLQGETYAFTLQLRRDRRGRLELISQEARYAAHYVVEPTAPCRVWQIWDDDDATRDLGELERFCRALLEAWFSTLEPGIDADDLAELPLLGVAERETLLRYLRVVTARRKSLASEHAGLVAELEARISAAAPDSPAAEAWMEEWSQLGDILAIAESPTPWPTYALSLDDDE